MCPTAICPGKWAPVWQLDVRSRVAHNLEYSGEFHLVQFQSETVPIDLGTIYYIVNV